MATEDVEAERTRLEIELQMHGFNPGMPDAATQARRAARIAEIQAALAALPRAPEPPRPPSGRRVFIDGRLGTGYLENPNDAPSYHCATHYDPFEASPTARRDE